MSPKFKPDVIGELPALLRYAWSLTRNPAAAEDLVHDTLVAAYEHRRSYDRRRPLRPWLFTILRNRFLSDRRREALHSASIENSAALRRDATEPAQEYAAALSEVEARFSALPPEQREALHLVVVEGLSYQEAAATIDIAIGTLMSRIARAREKLRNPSQEAAVSADSQKESGARRHLRVVKK